MSHRIPGDVMLPPEKMYPKFLACIPFIDQTDPLRRLWHALFFVFAYNHPPVGITMTDYTMIFNITLSGKKASRSSANNEVTVSQSKVELVAQWNAECQLQRKLELMQKLDELSSCKEFAWSVHSPADLARLLPLVLRVRMNIESTARDLSVLCTYAQLAHSAERVTGKHTGIMKQCLFAQLISERMPEASLRERRRHFHLLDSALAFREISVRLEAGRVILERDASSEPMLVLNPELCTKLGVVFVESVRKGRKQTTTAAADERDDDEDVVEEDEDEEGNAQESDEENGDDDEVVDIPDIFAVQDAV